MCVIRTQETPALELLAPAGSFEAFKAAVENGADAVYLGGQNFSARAGAANFDQEALGRAIRYAHERKVKVYVAVNILLSDLEFPQLLDYLFDLQELGADALIVQDIGVADLVRTVLPEMKIHASTQMTVNTSWGAQHLERLGFSRVVPARETSAAELKEISGLTTLELEVFVHGALCICYSGQCLMSSFIGGRSGNRGTCAQPCRMTYHLVNAAGEDLLLSRKLGDHLLSPRDLNLVEELAALRESGVHSLKIEGRMKRPEYVATVVRIYRQALERLAEQKENSLELSLPEEDRRELFQIFNRDFTQGYFRENPGEDLMSYSRPNNRGTRLGRVVVAEAGRLFLKLDAPLRLGDGIEVWTGRGREGAAADKIWRSQLEVAEGAPGETVAIPFRGAPQPGDRVFKTNDAQLTEKARWSFQEGREQRKLPLTMRLTGQVGEKLRLDVWESGRNVAVYSTEVLQKAVKRPLTQEYAFQQLGRLGTTPFSLHTLELETAEDVMLPVSALNEMRRLAVEELLRGEPRPIISRSSYEQRLKKWARGLAAERQGYLDRKEDFTPPQVSVAVSDMDGLQAALRAGAKRVLIGGEQWRSRRGFSLSEIRESLESCRKRGVDCVWRLPRILNQAQSADLLADLRQAAQWAEKPKLMAANLGELEMIQTLDTAWPWEVDYALNIFNEASLAYCLRFGAKGVTLSPELHNGQLANLGKWPGAEMLVFGDLEMMVSEHCPIGATLGGKKGLRCSGPCRREKYFLRDRLSYDFPLETDQACRMHLFNVKVLNLYEELPQIRNMGFSRVRLQLTRYDPEQVRRVVSLFVSAWERIAAGKKSGGNREVGISDLAPLFPRGFTKGHFFRGVID